MYLHLYRKIAGIWSKLHTAGCRPSFAKLGKKATIWPPSQIWGEDRIWFGDRSFLGAGSWMMVLKKAGGFDDARIVIGDDVSISGNCTISACREIIIEDGVLMGRYVHVSDHSHAFGEAGVPVKDQGLDHIKPVKICAGAWLGQGVIVCPGVTIGKGAVIGANSVVRQDVPDRCVAVGAPARIVRELDKKESGE